MTRYSIIVREYGSDHDVTLMHVGSNPQAIVDGLRAKTLSIGKRRTRIPKYTSIRIVERTPMVDARRGGAMPPNKRGGASQRGNPGRGERR
jgi:hypothetical protein